MPNQKAKEPQYLQRPADMAVAQSEKKMGAMSIIAKSQIKVWKAMLFSLFFAGFIGALAWAIAFDSADDKIRGSEAAGLPGVTANGTNIAPLAEVRGNSFAMRGQDGSDGWKLINDGDLSADSVMVRTSLGTPPLVDLVFPSAEGQAVKSLAIALDPENPKYPTCGLEKFTVMSSLDGKEFTKAVEGSQSNTAGFQTYAFPSGTSAKVLRVILEKNHGNPDWICLKEIQVMQ